MKKLQYRFAFFIFFLGSCFLALVLGIQYFYHPNGEPMQIQAVEQRLTLYSGLGLSLLMALAAALAARRFTAPLGTLSRRVRRIGEGDLETLVAPCGTAELDALAEAFNDMLARLRETTISRDLLAQEVRRRASTEAALRASREQLQEAQRVALMASFEWELATGKLRWSGGAEVILRSLGGSGSNRDFWKAIHPEDRPKVERALGRAFEQQDKPFEADFRFLLEGGIEQAVHGQGKVFRDEAGEPVRMIGTIQDISRRKLAEDALQNALSRTRTLAGSLKEKNRELEQAHEELKNTQLQLLQREKMASIGQLAAGVAHEINNPIGFISSNLNSLGKFVDSLLRVLLAQKNALERCGCEEENAALEALWKKEKVDFLLQDVRELIAESLDGTLRVSRIVQDLKSFSRVDQAQKSLVDLRDCLESTLNIAWNELKYKTTVEKDFGDIPQTRCYPQQLNQVFLNLLVNASQAIEDKGLIRLRTWHENNRILLSFSDTGKGMDPATLARIFEPFYTTKPAGSGTGLGLSISYDIIKKHEGEIAVQSAPGQGTTFTLSLPVCL